MKMQKSFTLIEVLVGTFLILIVFLGIFGAYQLALKVIGQSRTAITALTIANQQMEKIRNLPYQGIGTVGGIPAGPLLFEEIITRNRIDYLVKTTIIYIDDPFDGLAPIDDIPTDYKRVEIRVSWLGFFGGERVLVTNIAPMGKETDVAGGTLAISVFNAEGIGVAGTNIHILNTKISPIIDIHRLTDPEGRFVLVGAPESEEGYQITISKTNYSTDRTFGRDEVAEPLKPHASVWEGDFAEISFSIDLVSSLQVETRGSKDLGYPVIPNLTFSLRGARIIGYDIEGEPVYRYSQIYTTDAGGNITITGLKWDAYTFYVDKAVTGFDLIGIESPPGTEIEQPIDFLPNTLKKVRLVLGSENSLLITVQDGLTLKPIFGAKVRIYNIVLGHDKTRLTDKQGQAFFAPLEEVTYNLEVSALGYLSVTTTVSIVGDIVKVVKMLK